MNDILVSINCVTYNHEDYIHDAIEGFLMQKTDFEFEILIHDDASTDKTRVIIKEYERKYPELIKTIYQTENQYSKGVKPTQINLGRAKGKYVAFCEGDDFWTDPYKLQKQVDFMEANPEYSMCGHATKVIDVTLNKEIDWGYKKYGQDMELPFDILSERLFFQTATMLIRSEYIKNGYPEFYKISPNGDFALQLWMAHLGKVYYLDEIMSIHRKFAPHSYNVKYHRTEEQRINNAKKLIEMLNKFNVFSNNEHLGVIQQRIESLKVAIKRTENIMDRIHKDKILDITTPNHFKKIVGNEVFIFAAGVEGKHLLELLNSLGIYTMAFIDNNVDLHGKMIKGKLVCSIEDMDCDSTVIVSSSSNAEDIVNQLEGLGFENYYLFRR